MNAPGAITGVYFYTWSVRSRCVLLKEGLFDNVIGGVVIQSRGEGGGGGIAPSAKSNKNSELQVVGGEPFGVPNCRVVRIILLVDGWPHRLIIY